MPNRTAFRAHARSYECIAHAVQFTFTRPIRWADSTPMIFERALECWIFLCASLAFAGWLFSGLSILNGPAYLVFVLVFLFLCFVLPRKLGLPEINFRRDALKLVRRIRKLPAFLFLCLVLFSFIGAFAYKTIHFDSLSYRLPRALHWLAEGKWHWIHTPDVRMNVVACSTEWLWAAIMLVTDSERVLCLTNLISFVFLPGLLYAFFIRVGIRRRLAWWWMWILPAGYCYAFQAGSLATDGYATIFCLAAVVYAFKAAERKNPYYLWISMMALGFATGTKQTNLIVVPLWFVAAITSWRLLLQRPLLTASACIIALFASFFPSALANMKYAGNWNGFHLEEQSKLWCIVGNAFALPVENLLPPVFPAAPQWNNAMERFVETPFGSHFAGFENFAHLYRGPSENLGGLGLGTCLVLLLGLVYRRRASQRAADWQRRALLILPWILVLAFMASVTIAKCARYLAFFYPFMFAAVLYATGSPFRHRWWRICACASMIVTLGTMVVSRQRPLFPVDWTSLLVEKIASKNIADKARNAFAWAREVRATIDAFHDALPPQTKIAGYVSEAGNLEVSLWHPYGTRRVWRFSGDDTPEFIRSKGVEYLILEESSVDRSGAGSIQAWLQRFRGEVVFSRPMPTEPGGPLSDTYLVRLLP